MLLLGSMRAEERLAAFLLNLSQRYRERGYSSTEFVLRMSREEIGSYLGLKLETISWALFALSTGRAAAGAGPIDQAARHRDARAIARTALIVCPLRSRRAAASSRIAAWMLNPSASRVSAPRAPVWVPQSLVAFNIEPPLHLDSLRGSARGLPYRFHEFVFQSIEIVQRFLRFVTFEVLFGQT